MTGFIFFYSASCFIAGLICLVVGIYVVLRSRQSINRLYFFLSVLVFVEGLSKAFMRSAPSAEVAFFWFVPAVFAW